MEFCGVFYETGYLRAVYDRIRKLFFVFLMAAVLTVGMMGQGMETINFGSVRLKDMAGRAVAEYAAGVRTTGSFMISVTEIQISADVSADLFTVPAVISERSEDLNTGNSAAVVLPVEDAISDALMAEETISNILPGEETVPDAPIIETILPNDPPILRRSAEPHIAAGRSKKIKTVFRTSRRQRHYLRFYAACFGKIFCQCLGYIHRHAYADFHLFLFFCFIFTGSMRRIQHC